MRFSFIYSPFSKFICSTSLNNVTEQSEDCGDKFQNDRIQSLKQYGAEHRFYNRHYAYCNAIVYMTALWQVLSYIQALCRGLLLTDVSYDHLYPQILSDLQKHKLQIYGCLFLFHRKQHNHILQAV